MVIDNIPPSLINLNSGDVSLVSNVGWLEETSIRKIIMESVSVTEFMTPVGKDGINGADGQDYVLTEADKAEIVASVLEALPKAEEMSV